MNNAEKVAAWKSQNRAKVKGQRKRAKVRAKEIRERNIAILDLETDPFDNQTQVAVFPFLAILYSERFEPVIIWEEDWRKLIQAVVDRLAELPEDYTIYAHNGGRFDFMFFMHELRGAVSFKGRAIMQGKIGRHRIRDSFHIIPEALKNANRKDDIDYQLMKRDQRGAHRQQIIDYCLSDCKYTFEIVKAFIARFGMPLTIGQAAMARLKEKYEFKTLDASTDEFFRTWFHGGRTECLAPVGRYKGDFRLYDVHSMYPDRMANCEHPIGNEFYINDQVTKRTAFIHLRCKNRGAFLSVDERGLLTSRQREGEFYVSVYEYRTARELNLIRDVEIIRTIDFYEWTNFAKFILPLYHEREILKEKIADMEAGGNLVALDDGKRSSDYGPEYWEAQRESLFLKLLMNNAYGKFAQNPRRFKEHYLTSPDDAPPPGWLEKAAQRELFLRKRYDPDARIEDIRLQLALPEQEHPLYNIWARPSMHWRFNNVATAASITGASRAKLLWGIHHAYDPIYCDTDSIMCRDVHDLPVTKSELGTWGLEKQLSEIILCGKKLYAYRDISGKEKVKAKGVNTMVWSDYEKMINGETVRKVMKAPTISRLQSQTYITRDLRLTA